MTDRKPDGDWGYEIMKWLGISITVITAVVVVCFMFPSLPVSIGFSLFGGNELKSSLSTAYGSVVKDLNDLDKQPKGDYSTQSVSTSEMTKPLAYGEGLCAKNSLEQNATIGAQDIAGKKKFPQSQLGQCSPLPYSSIVGKKTSATMKPGDFFTTANVAF